MTENIRRYAGKAFRHFKNYAEIHTTSSETSGTHPSFVGEWDLAKLLAKELQELGLRNVRLDEHCYVYADLPASEGFEQAPAMGLIAHMDTSDAASGENVRVLLHENYQGGDIALPGGRTLSPREFPFLKKLEGETVVTSDGTTLLGADDKAGVAEIMTALEILLEDDLPHGPLRIAFTPDEEIGEGTLFFDVEGFGAKYAYTVDGGDSDEIEYENFNAAAAELLFHGRSVHPGTAKDVMVNASRLAIEFQMMLPQEECPEKTQDREGFYHLTGMEGNVSTAKLQYIIRDHDRAKFEERKTFIRQCAERIREKYGENAVELKLQDSYYNMIEKILPHRHLIENAEKAIREAGMESVSTPVRGGTDGANLSFRGLPCPNLGTGGFNFHGEYECTTVERMDRAVSVLLNLISLYKDYREA